MSEAVNAPKVKLVPWWLVLIEGILLIIIGIFLLTNPAATFVTIIWVLGIYWLISGIFNIIKIFFDSSMWGWKIFAGIVGIIAGWFLIQNPIGGSVVVSTTTVILLGLFGIFIGIVNLIQAFRGAGWGTGILGVISIILGIILLANRFLFTFSLPWALGILAIIGGIIAIFNAFRIRSAKKDLEEAADAAQVRAASMADSAAPTAAAAGAATVGAVGAAAAATQDKADDAADTVDDAAEAVADTADDVADAAGDGAAAAAAAAVVAAEAVSDDDDASRATTIDLDKEMSEEDMAAAIAMRFPNLSADQQASVTELVASVRSLTPDDAEKLIQAGIEKSQTLLERGASRPGRADISRETNILEPVVLKWINDLDLARIKGVGVKYSDLLEEAGVDTVVELAQRNSANLYKKLVEVNEELNLVEAMPSEQEVADWVAQAKELPRVITY
jgi:uncharacterized membrane protein HdeD (DUF308 family)/predicted flap endonuclease-1-like 5' DNA nuclease